MRRQEPAIGGIENRLASIFLWSTFTTDNFFRIRFDHFRRVIIGTLEFFESPCCSIASLICSSCHCSSSLLVIPQRFRTTLLLVASYLFYMNWKPVYGLLILGLTFVNYILGLLIYRLPDFRKPLLAAGAVFNIGLFYASSNTQLLS